MNDVRPVLTVREFLILTLLAAIVATMLVLALTSGASTGAEHEAAWRHVTTGVPPLGYR